MLHRFEQGVQGDVEDFAGAGRKHDILTQRAEEGRSRNVYIVIAGNQSGQAEESLGIGIRNLGLSSRAEQFNGRAHLRHAGCVSDVSRN